jgi:tRNA-dihydrouridine synthase
VVSRGAGAALLKDLPRMGKVIEAVKQAVSLPVSVKTRIGFSPQETRAHLEIARIAADSGADLLAVHARYARRFHAGEADWEKLGEMKSSLRIPLIGNGGINHPEDAARMIELSGVDGVMIGRAAIGNPWIFRMIRGAGSAPSLAERRDMVAEHLTRLVALNRTKQASLSRPARYSPEEAACIQFRTHLPLYIRGLFGRKLLLRQLPELRTPEAILQALDEVLERNDPESRKGSSE